jgi:hypothetical protein
MKALMTLALFASIICAANAGEPDQLDRFERLALEFQKYAYRCHGVYLVDTIQAKPCQRVFDVHQELAPLVAHFSDDAVIENIKQDPDSSEIHARSFRVINDAISVIDEIRQTRN